MNIAQALELKVKLIAMNVKKQHGYRHATGINALELKLRLEQELTEIQEHAFEEGLRVLNRVNHWHVTGSQPFGP